MNKKEEKVTEKKKVVKKQAAKKATTKKSLPKTTGTKAVAPKKLSISPRERYEMIATMAYYRAEQRDFEPGHDVEDWLDCERTIDMMIKG